MLKKHNMWYRKAIDLSDLKKMFPEEAQEASEEFQTDEILDKFQKGEEYTSPSGAISVRESPEEQPFQKNELDATFKFYDTALDFYESLMDKPDDVEFMIKTLDIIDRYINPHYKSEAIQKLKFIQSRFSYLVEKYWKIIVPEQELSYKGEYSRVSEEDLESAVLLSKSYTKILNELLPRIQTRDAQDEWLRAMAKRGVAANYLRDDLKDRYLEIFNQRWGF
jgi:hypothetical protein